MEGCTFKLIGKPPYSSYGTGLQGVTIDCASIRSINHRMNATLVTIPIPVFLSSNTFAMDTGTKEEYTIKFRRTTPNVVNDSSTDSTQWSNAKFMDMLRTYIDRWQMVTDGWTAQFTPDGQYAELYPSFSKNVYLTGISEPYDSSTYFEASLTMIVGTLLAGVQPELQYQLTYICNGYEQYKNSALNFLYPSGFQVPAISLPSQWANADPGRAFLGWALSSTATTPDYYPGDPITITRATKLYGVWGETSVLKEYYEPGVYYFIVDQRYTQLTFHLHGGGGGGGGGVGSGGGGGGAGAYVTYSVANPVIGDTIELHVGQGGGGGGYRDLAQDGTESSLPAYLVIASGGNRGGQGNTIDDGRGGAGVKATIGGVEQTDTSSAGGNQNSDGEGDNGGRGGAPYLNIAGGGGGGGPTRFETVNGNGGWGAWADKGFWGSTPEKWASEGTYGGGGGGGSDWTSDKNKWGAKGGNGWVIVMGI